MPETSYQFVTVKNILESGTNLRSQGVQLIGRFITIDAISGRIIIKDPSSTSGGDSRSTNSTSISSTTQQQEQQNHLLSVDISLVDIPPLTLRALLSNMIHIAGTVDVEEIDEASGSRREETERERGNDNDTVEDISFSSSSSSSSSSTTTATTSSPSIINSKDQQEQAAPQIHTKSYAATAPTTTVVRPYVQAHIVRSAEGGDASLLMQVLQKRNAFLFSPME